MDTDTGKGTAPIATPPIQGIAAGRLIVEVTGDPPEAHDLIGEVVRVGRAADNDIRLNAPFASRHVAELHRTQSGYRLEPLPGATPLTYDGRPLKGALDCTHGDVLRLTGPNAGEMLSIVYLDAEDLGAATGVIALDRASRIRIGSAPGSDLGGGDPTIEPTHAEIQATDGRVVLLPLARGETEVNGAKVDGPVQLTVGDAVRVGRLHLHLTPAGLEYEDTASQWLIGRRRARELPEDLLDRLEGQGGVLMEALHLHKHVRHGVDLLQDISLRVRPRELVILVGLSGSGKTTLLDALAGYRRATEGQVFVDHADLYHNFDRFRPRIGYVPQRDIIHLDLTVYEALDYAARLRMPPGTTPEQRHKRLEEVMEDLDLSERKDVRVRALSGGQQKRVSIGVELITSPQLFFLDEPTSGLDPGTETGLMQLLRRLADQGRTIIVITHATKNVMLSDKVLFMVRGGYIAWYGPPREALEYFNAKRPELERDNGSLEFDAIYGLLEDSARGSPHDWAGRYQDDGAYRKYIAAPLHIQPVGTGERPAPQPPPEPIKQISGFRQFMILSSRNFRLLLRDKIALVLMLAVAPVLAALDLLLITRNMYDPTLGDPLRATIGAFTLAANGVFVGALSQTREIIKDKEIYKRERLVNLDILPYVLSKVWVAAVLALYQSAVWFLARYFTVHMTGGVLTAFELYITIFLAVMAGMMLGLLASAITPSEQAVTLIVALFIIPQMFFAGSFIPISKLDPAGQKVSTLMATRWTFESVMTISQMGKDLGTDPGWQLPKAVRQKLTPAQKKVDKCLGINIFTQCTFPGIRSFYRPSVNAPPPKKPAAPPVTASPTAQAQYRVQLARYQQSVAAWQAGRTAPIASAEAVLEDQHDKYGDTYNVNIAGHWLILGGISVVLCLLIIGVQRSKDRL